MSAVGVYGPTLVFSGNVPSPIVLASTPVTVKNTDGSAATLYTDRTGTSTTSNVIATDSQGNLTFYAAPGPYLIQYTNRIGAQSLEVEVPPTASTDSATFVPFDSYGYEAMQGMGDFDIWMDGTSFANPASGTYVASLWLALYDGSAGTFTISQNGGPLTTGAPNGCEWNQTVAGAGDSYRILEYRIEDGSFFNGRNAILSFYANAAAPTTIQVAVRQFFGTGGSPSADVVATTQTVNLTTGIQQYQIPVAMPATSGKTFGSTLNDCVKIQFLMPTNATFDVVLRQVAFDLGARLLPFRQVPLPVKHNHISRYLQYTIVSLGATATGAGQFIYCPVPFKAEMRRVPTTFLSTVAGASNANCTTTTLTHVNRYGATAYISSSAAGAFYDIGRQIRLDARL